MQLDLPSFQQKDGELDTYVDIGYGRPHGVIRLSDDARLRYVYEDDCDRLIKAAAAIKEGIRASRAKAAQPHGSKHFWQGTCQLCGKPEDDELHAEPCPCCTADPLHSDDCNCREDCGVTQCQAADPDPGDDPDYDEDCDDCRTVQATASVTGGEDRCACSHHETLHDNDGSRECRAVACGCNRFRLAAPRPHAGPPAVVNGDVVLEVRALLS